MEMQQAMAHIATQIPPKLLGELVQMSASQDLYAEATADLPGVFAAMQRSVFLADSIQSTVPDFYPPGCHSGRQHSLRHFGRANWNSTSSRHRAPQPCELRGSQLIKGLGTCAAIRDLKGLNPLCIVVVRKVHHLGSQVEAALSEHFAWYGEVRGVFAPESQGMSHKRRAVRRPRPPTLAFVVMAAAAAAEAVLAAGLTEHVVCGRGVLVEPYREYSAAPPIQASPDLASSSGASSRIAAPSPEEHCGAAAREEAEGTSLFFFGAGQLFSL